MRMHRFQYPLICMGLSILLVYACGPDTGNKDPQYILDQAYKVHGSKLFDESIIDFKVGKRFYKSSRDHGQYLYERFWDSLGVTLHDDLNNKGVTRQFDQTVALLDTKKIDELSNSMRNFFLLFSIPFGLNEPWMIKNYLGELILMEKPYHKIKITFKLDPNNRTIYDDEYVLWINKSKNTVDYIGYKHSGPTEKGVGFRQAINPRKVEGFMVQDYKVFTPIQDSVTIKIEDLDQAWVGNQLKESGNVQVTQFKIRIK